MPPTRGHDLKHKIAMTVLRHRLMPPTRGHDLKQRGHKGSGRGGGDAPHTGARLETSWPGP